DGHRARLGRVIDAVDHLLEAVRAAHDRPAALRPGVHPQPAGDDDGEEHGDAGAHGSLLQDRWAVFYFAGTRVLSSSNQLATTWICRLESGASAVATVSTMMTKCLPSGARS